MNPEEAEGAHRWFRRMHLTSSLWCATAVVIWLLLLRPLRPNRWMTSALSMLVVGELMGEYAFLVGEAAHYVIWAAIVDASARPGRKWVASSPPGVNDSCAFPEAPRLANGKIAWRASAS